MVQNVHTYVSVQQSDIRLLDINIDKYLAHIIK